MKSPEILLRQHLIDPQLCLRCNGCEETCRKHAISHDWQNYAIDPAQCDACMECIEQCPTGAINNWHTVPASEVYTLDTQLVWTDLPPAPLIDLQPPETIASKLHEAFGAPASAARPVELLFHRETPALARVITNCCVTKQSTDTHIHHIVLDLQGQYFPLLEGQTIGVLPPGMDANQHPHAMRAYSVASSREGEDGQPGQLALTVKRVTQNMQGQPMHGVCSNYLCDLAEGAEVRVVGPFGSHYLMPDDPETRLILIATGTGIAPMRAMLERRIRQGSAGADRLLLFYGGRTKSALPYLEQLLHHEGQALGLHLALSREPGVTKQYVQEVLAEHAAQVLSWLDDGRGYLYLCGLRGMEAGVMDTLQAICAASGRDWSTFLDRMKVERRFHIETY